MDTKLQQKHRTAIFPAGITEGIECFWYNNQKYIMVEGEKMLFEDAPGKIQRMIADACRNDHRRVAYAKSQGVTTLSGVFEWWYRCVVGGYDYEADFLNGKFKADAFNSTCTDYDCRHRGKFCGTASQLNGVDVKTLLALKQGASFRKTASMLFVSEAGLKSRVTKLRQKVECRNTAALTARAAELRI